MTQSVDDLLLSLYLATPDKWESLLQGVRMEDIPALIQRAVDQKLYTQIYRAISSRYEPSVEEQNRYKFWEQRRSETLALVETLTQALPDVSHAFLKGFTLQSYYPPHIQRFYGDLDLSLPDMDSFWRFADFILHNGFEMKTTLNLFKDSHTSDYRCLARFHRIEDSDYPLDIEIQCGFFWITLSTYLPLQEFFHDQTKIQLGQSAVHILSRRSTFLVYLAELMSRPGALRLRDLADLTFMCNAESEQWDLNDLVRIINQYSLHYTLYLIQKSFAKQSVIPVPPLLLQLFDQLLIEGDVKQPEDSHVWPFHKRNSRTPVKQYLFHRLRKWTQQLNDQDRFLFCLKQSDLLLGTKGYRENGMLLYLSPINDHSSDFLWTKVGLHEVIYTPIGCFAVSKHALQSDEDFDFLEQQLS